ncbi:MAG: efflux RND transporter permease subunit [Azospirillum sp.]|nr:efflux RND transporter permease subunit [Azospirillum sp.]MCZ8124297.1 efflux RND transporter permease subunit [Magnetospirillum sp.]
MVLSDVSIKRPVFATVISLLIVVLGLAAYQRLPVREYPAIDPPIVNVTTVYKGASNQVVESRVTELIESAVAGIEGVRGIVSQSREERSSVSIEFRLGRDIDAASADVRDRVARVRARLPDGVDDPIIAKVDGDQRAILWLTLASDRYSQLELTDYARRNIVDRLSIVPGVAQVNISGERRYSMRVWLDRQALAARQLTVDDVETAIRRQNVELPSGRIESTQRELTVKTDSRLSTPEQFRDIVVTTRQGYQIRLGEVARVEVGSEDERSGIRANGKTAIGIGIVRQSTGNTLTVANGAKEEMARIAENFPEGISLMIGYDESVFIAQSIYEVYHALAIGIALVIGVIFAFLRSWRATLIPAIAIPVSIIGSFTVLSALGFSLNVLTLLALVLAIGIVVDDAIVVLENIHRRIEEGEPVLLASVRGSRQIAFAVIATTATLIAVFVPISFMEGNTGRLFTEFGIALAAAVLFSGLVALSLTPMMCSKLLKTHEGEGKFYLMTEKIFTGMNAGYRWLLVRAMAAPVVVLAGGIAVSAAAYGFWASLPKEFAPVEDRGVIIIPITAPEGASFGYTREAVQQVERVLQPYLDSGVAAAVMGNIAPGFQRPAPVNSGLVFLRLKPWGERYKDSENGAPRPSGPEIKQQQIVQQIFPRIAGIPGVRAAPVNPPALGQRGFQPPVQFVIGGTNYETVREWRDRIMNRAGQDARFLNLDSNYRETKPELRVRIDRARAADLGISVETIGRTLETMFGARNVSTYVDRGEEYNVILQARSEDRATPADLAGLFVRSATTQQLIPLSSLVTLVEAAGPAELNRVDRLRSITITSSLAPNFTIGEALAELERFAAEELPPEARISYQGQSREFKESAASLYVTFGLALLIVFLVLAAQFESWIHPFIIMLAVPLAVTGGLGALWFTGISLNVYSQIGMILLIGLMAKNGILIVEFANQLRDEGHDIRSAVIEASVARLRPILMTSIATVVGAVPLADARGAGAESREAIGWVIIGGVAFATILTSFVIPALYLLLARFTKPVGAIAARLAQQERTQDVRQPQAAE